jgi:type II secretory pathway pseudopilin PulG
MEVLVGMAILGIAYAVLFSLISSSLRNVDRVGEREKILRYGQMKLNELVLRAGQGEVVTQQDGKFDERYSWKARTDLEELPGRADKPTLGAPAYQLAKIRLSVNWTRNAGQENEFNLETATWVPVLQKEKE